MLFSTGTHSCANLGKLRTRTCMWSRRLRSCSAMLRLLPLGAALSTASRRGTSQQAATPLCCCHIEMLCDTGMQERNPPPPACAIENMFRVQVRRCRTRWAGAAGHTYGVLQADQHLCLHLKLRLMRCRQPGHLLRCRCTWHMLSIQALQTGRPTAWTETMRNRRRIMGEARLGRNAVNSGGVGLAEQRCSGMSGNAAHRSAAAAAPRKRGETRPCLHQPAPTRLLSACAAWRAAGGSMLAACFARLSVLAPGGWQEARRREPCI